jgi:hypothetical protein
MTETDDQRDAANVVAELGMVLESHHDALVNHVETLEAHTEVLDALAVAVDELCIEVGADEVGERLRASMRALIDRTFIDSDETERDEPGSLDP